jgi:hypothetical protein
MKKTSNGRLLLTTQTVRDLRPRDLREVAGGTGTNHSVVQSAYSAVISAYVSIQAKQ